MPCLNNTSLKKALFLWNCSVCYPKIVTVGFEATLSVFSLVSPQI